MTTTSSTNGMQSAIDTLHSRLSRTSKVFLRESTESKEAPVRWSAWATPGLDVAVEVATEDDVAETVSCTLMRNGHGTARS